MDKNLRFLGDTCVTIVEEIRTDRQLAELAEVAKVNKNGGTDIALMMTDAEKKNASASPSATASRVLLGARPYSHDTQIIAEAQTKAKAKAKAKAKSKAQPAAAATEKGKGKGKGKGRARASASAGTSTTRLLVARRAPSATSCTRLQRWLRRWMPRALLLSRMLRGRSASRLAALALSDEPGRRRRQLSRRPPRASQCGFWIPAPATTW